MNKDAIFEDKDPLDDPHWRKASAPKRLSGRFIGCPVPWFQWVVRLAKSKDQLALALYLYRRCCICNSDTVTAPTDEIVELLNIGRWGKYRLLPAMEQAGILQIHQNGSTDDEGAALLLAGSARLIGFRPLGAGCKYYWPPSPKRLLAHTPQVYWPIPATHLTLSTLSYSILLYLTLSYSLLLTL